MSEWSAHIGAETMAATCRNGGMSNKLLYTLTCLIIDNNKSYKCFETYGLQNIRITLTFITVHR